MPDPMNLEPTAPAPAAPAAGPAAPAPPVAPADPDDAIAIDLPEGKHVPLSALKTAREEAKALKEKAAQADQQAAWIAQNKPYVDFIQQNQHLLRQPQQPAPQQPTGTPTQEDAELEELARSLDFYTSDAKPDLRRAKVHQQLIDRQAARIAQQVVAPIAINTYTDQANRNWHTAVQEKLPNGQPIDANLLRTAWVAVGRQNPAQLADPGSVRVIVNNVMMEQMRASPLPNAGVPGATPPLPPPVITEGVGPKPSNTNRMNDEQRAIVSSRGIDDAKFHKLTQDFRPGRMNPLED